MAEATLTEDDALAPSECFRIEHDDRYDLVELRQPVKKKLEAQYRRWQDHDQYCEQNPPYTTTLNH